MPFGKSLAAALIVLCSTGVAIAADNTACYDRIEGQEPANTFINKGMTDFWRQMLKVADPKLMAQIAGVYYGERPSPDGQYLNKQYRRFDANGLFDYQDQTCGNIAGIACSTNQGTGEWRAVNQTDGSTYLMARFSDLIRTDACFGDRISLRPGGMVDESGVFWQKTR